MTTEPATVTDGETLDDTSNPQGETPTQASGETPETTTDAQKELERLRTSLKRANAEAKANREAAAELTKLKADAEEATQTQTEKLQKQLAELQKSYETEKQQAQAYKINAEVRLHAAQLGFVDVDDAVTFFEKKETQSRIDYDDNGTPTNVEDLLKALANEKKYLLKGKAPTTTTGGATNPSRSSSTAQQALSWEIIGQMKPDEYMARRPEIAKWISEHPHRYGSGM